MASKEEALEELKKRGVVLSTESILEDKGTTLEEFTKFGESLLKGSARGFVNILGGWGNLYDYLKKSNDPSAFSSAGISRAIRDLTGVDIQQIRGYRGTGEFGEAGAPAAALSALGLPGLFRPTPMGLAKEATVAGTTGVLAPTLAPDSPLAQFAIQSTPYALKGSLTSARSMINRPEGQVPTNLDELLRVGRMTPGEATGSRPQLATEARTEASTRIGEAGNIFRIAQTEDVNKFLTAVFNRASSQAVSPDIAATSAITAFNNYGKALSSKLKTDSARDFAAARSAKGTVDTTPVLTAIDDWAARIPPETPGFEAIKTAIARIKDEYLIPAKPATVTPSTVLGPTGQPATVSITPATPAGVQEISIDRLQKNLSAWGEAVYSGKADFGKGNIFEGVAPGQVKGAALSILRGFRESLDQAIAQGVPGADKLKAARDNFKNNLNRIEEYSNYPLVRYFDVPTASALTPEDVIDKLAKAKPSERLLLVAVLRNHPDAHAIFDTVRRSQFETILNKARTAAAAAPEGSPNIDTKVLLKELNNKQGDFNYLFLDPTTRADAVLAIQWLQKTAKTARETDGGVGGNVYGTTRGIGGTAQQGLILRELSSVADVILRDPKAAAAVIFDQDTVRKMAEAQRRGKIGNATDLLQSIGKATAVQAVRAGPRMDTGGVVDTSELQPPQKTEEEITQEQALEELRKRGLLGGQ